MNFKYSQTADAIYIQLKDGLVVRTDSVDEGTLVDIDASGAAIGIEIINPARHWPVDEVTTKYNVSSHNRKLLAAWWKDANGHSKTFPITEDKQLADH